MVTVLLLEYILRVGVLWALISTSAFVASREGVFGGIVHSDWLEWWPLS